MRLRTLFFLVFVFGTLFWKCTYGWPLGGGVLYHEKLGEGGEILIEEDWRDWMLANGYGTRLWYRTGPGELWSHYWIHAYGQDRWTEEPEMLWDRGVDSITLQVFYKGKRRGYFHLRKPAGQSTFRNGLDFVVDPSDQPDWP